MSRVLEPTMEKGAAPARKRSQQEGLGASQATVSLIEKTRVPIQA